MENETKIFLKKQIEEAKQRVNENGKEADIKVFEIVMDKYLMHCIHSEAIEKIKCIAKDMMEFKEDIPEYVFDDMEPEEKISVMESFFSEQRMLGCAAIESLLKYEKELLQRIGEKDV